MQFFYLLPPSRTHHLNISQDTLILFTLQKFAQAFSLISR